MIQTIVYRSPVAERVGEGEQTHATCVVELADEVVELLVGDLAVGVGIGLLHQLHPDILPDFFAVAQGVPQLADLDLPAVVLVENLEDFDYVGLSDQEEPVRAVGQKLRKSYFLLSESFQDLECIALRLRCSWFAQKFHEPLDEVAIIEKALAAKVQLHEHSHDLLLLVEGDQRVHEENPSGLLKFR